VRDNEDGTSTIHWDGANTDAGFITVGSRDHARRIIEAGLQAEQNLIRHEAREFAQAKVAAELAPLPVEAIPDYVWNTSPEEAEAILRVVQPEELPQRVKPGYAAPPLSPPVVPGPDTPVPPAGPGTSTIDLNVRSPEVLPEYEDDDLEPLPQRVTDCHLCDLYGNHGACDEQAEANPSRPPCACRQDGHVAEQDES
jgi:hypothetical protein